MFTTNEIVVDMAGTSGVTVTGAATGVLTYTLANRRLVQNRPLIIDGDLESLVFKDNL